MLSQKNKVRAYINNADEPMVEYYRVFAKRIKHLLCDWFGLVWLIGMFRKTSTLASSYYY